MAKGTFWADFKAFIAKGNMIDMAVGIIIGGAFGKIISSLVDNILMPPLGVLIGGVDFKELKIVLSIPESLRAGVMSAEPVAINYGLFIQSIIDFLIIALCVFFFVRLYMRHKERVAQAEAAAREAVPAPKPDDVALLEEIRDLLKKQKNDPASK